MPPAEARLLAMLSDGRIGEALALDVNTVRAQQQELLALVSSKSLGSITTILTAAESLAKADRAPEILSSLARWIRDLVILQVGGDRAQLFHTDQIPTFEGYAARAHTDALLGLLHDIEQTEQQATRNLNLHMAFENILLRLRDALGLAPAGATA